MTLDFSRCPLPPFEHQRADVQAMIDNPFLFITSEMRTGKTKIVIDGAQFLFERNVIDRVLVIAPAPVRDVWFDQTLGEIIKHTWRDIAISVREFHARSRYWVNTPQSDNGSRLITRRLDWCVTNFEFLRSKARLAQLLPFCNHRTLLVLDESSFVKNYAAAQTKACLQLRRACGRVVLLNGTPISHSPLDLFSQGNILHPKILDCKYITHYKARYAVSEPVRGAGGTQLKTPRGRGIEKITGWTNLDDIQRRFAPFTIRRLQKDCLDVPLKLDPVTITAAMTPETWRPYVEMRDEMVVWLKSGNVASAQTAAVKSLRLSQITSGFLGGVEASNTGVFDHADALDILEENESATMQEIGREKLDVLLWFIAQRLDVDPSLKAVVWARFRPELFRAVEACKAKFPSVAVAAIHGGQKKHERIEAMQLLHPDTAPKNTPVILFGTYGTGSFGLNFSAAQMSISLSYDYSLGKYLQSNDRIYGPSNKTGAAYFDIVCTGPKGQRTIDHHIIKGRRENQDLASWTTAAWINALTSE